MRVLSHSDEVGQILDIADMRGQGNVEFGSKTTKKMTFDPAGVSAFAEFREVHLKFGGILRD